MYKSLVRKFLIGRGTLTIVKLVFIICFATSSGFPGCQPVSMDVQNIRFLNEKPYRVSWKADGTR